MNTMLRRVWSKSFAVLAMAFVLGMNVSHAQEKLKPYVLASDQAGDKAQVIKDTKAALTAQGFEIVGEYSPYESADIIVVTSPELKSNAAKSKMGGYGAIQRVSVTASEGKLQVAYTNPVYMANVYRMAGDLSDVAAKLKAALGDQQTFGAEGLTPKELRNYHYKFLMPYFDDPYKLGKFDSYEKAVDAVEQGLAQKRGGVSKVYRVEIPGKQETVFGVHMTEGCSGDKFIMDKIDFGTLKSTPHLPYEVLVLGNEVYALAAKFRIAESFPDLSMVGSNSFFSIMCAPDAIETALTTMVGAKKESSGW
jgi:hypothetical protein